MIERTHCCVPFCRRTSSRFPGEWLCVDHWPLVDRRLKKIRSLLFRRWRRRGLVVKNADGRTYSWASGPHGFNCRVVEGRIWLRMKAQAIERAAS